MLLAFDFSGSSGSAGFQLDLNLPQLLLSIAQAQLVFFTFDFRENFLLAGFQLSPLDIVSPFCHLGEILLFLQPPLGSGTFDFGLSLFQLGSLLIQGTLKVRYIKLHEQLALFHLGAILDELDNLDVASARRRRKHHRLERFHLTSNVHVVYKLAQLHLGSADGRGSTFHSGSGKTNARDDNRGHHRGQPPPAFQKRPHFGAHNLRIASTGDVAQYNGSGFEARFNHDLVVTARSDLDEAPFKTGAVFHIHITLIIFGFYRVTG